MKVDFFISCLKSTLWSLKHRLEYIQESGIFSEETKREALSFNEYLDDLITQGICVSPTTLQFVCNNVMSSPEKERHGTSINEHRKKWEDYLSNMKNVIRHNLITVSNPTDTTVWEWLWEHLCMVGPHEERKCWYNKLKEFKNILSSEFVRREIENNKDLCKGINSLFKRMYLTSYPLTVTNLMSEVLENIQPLGVEKCKMKSF